MARKNDFTTRIDKLIGARVHERRISMGMSRVQLSEKIDVTHQQLQKYEKGTNRISVGRMAAISKALGKPLAEFFGGINSKQEIHTEHQRMCIELARNFLKLENPKHQTAINDMVRRLANS